MTMTSDSTRGTGRGFHSMASATLKMAVVAPMPSAIVKTAVAANPGDLRSMRAPIRTWFQNPMETNTTGEPAGVPYFARAAP